MQYHNYNNYKYIILFNYIFLFRIINVFVFFKNIWVSNLRISLISWSFFLISLPSSSPLLLFQVICISQLRSIHLLSFWHTLGTAPSALIGCLRGSWIVVGQQLGCFSQVGCSLLPLGSRVLAEEMEISMLTR